MFDHFAEFGLQFHSSINLIKRLEWSGDTLVSSAPERARIGTPTKFEAYKSISCSDIDASRI
jgi:hypothetical protein